MPSTTLHRQRGFNLIELMIVVAIIAIVATFAIPAYQDYVREAKRTEAQSLMLKVQLAQERWRANNPAYTSTLSDLGFSANALDDYTLSLSATTNSYTITMTAQGGQASDSAGATSCTPLTLDQSNSYGTKAACWQK